MKIFEGVEFIYRIRVNYKSGLQNDIWVSDFAIKPEGNNVKAEWTPVTSPSARKQVKEYASMPGVTEESIVRLAMSVVETPRPLFFGMDNVESIYQMETTLVEAFTNEFGSKVKSLSDYIAEQIQNQKQKKQEEE